TAHTQPWATSSMSCARRPGAPASVSTSTTTAIRSRSQTSTATSRKHCSRSSAGGRRLLPELRLERAQLLGERGNLLLQASQPVGMRGGFGRFVRRDCLTPTQRVPPARFLLSRTPRQLAHENIETAQRPLDFSDVLERIEPVASAAQL